ncbi:23S rRNA (guanosine(2251)-2'-O)-methyltransferase (EC 2.1.1.185) [uncultured Gammaproteobacteria bacterium]|jgi:23S rRNA (guanosine2251-2'-O)-methyltransferase|uniref:23S rRNA (Guanosine(2251)-2'-O)-methyltransferase (EC) n=4 Tax=sulfur-oxidizing symbionts TaxID=32036 RepID=A0ACA8ZT60_9GAMM|nr:MULTISPECIES: 23S rRNA (guanosine(2251)-2'-O)-methyltransferase RlmB [sulfur-oxidizing symbionts]CAC5862193.1 23S rRNA (guanosine(2251)-2'-O)-methyltransferase (EC 2.1.1.185) [uncultured Gammaproteobacteria bacterium]CAB5502741.1 23S rRNA (guanosine(2251)-2'-O)-methyltransferase (EC [Bathymodiolus thermophilus thioautotrophic gill symbiont]CAB5507303.1 23S rRNA (guanosine(2251)-2'-O)-methyltransferase (EC [Bathymodiolus azoricus thioautotrophic gill symbiont]CAC9498825.1 23S rRNA (guanosine(
MPKSIVIFGFHAIQAQLESNPECLLKVYTLDSRNDKRLNTISTQLDKLSINTQHATKQQLDKLTKNQTHQGVVAEILLPTLPNQDGLMQHTTKLEKTALILILDSIQDPRNLGACLRSANAAGVDCVVINKDGSAPINALVHKTSAGALNQLKIFSVTNLARTIKALKEEDIWVVGLDSSTKTSLYQIDLSTPSAIIMGSEGSGLRPLTKKSCDQLAMIPMQGNVESLNVSVATGIALFEASRQRLN